MTMTRATYVGLVVVLLTLCQSAFVAESRKVSFVADIHYDAYYGTSEGLGCTDTLSPVYGAAGCDSPLPLLKSVTEVLTKQQNELLLCVGDYQRHHARKTDSCSAIIDVVASHLGQTTVTKNQVVGTIGNNDVIPSYSFDAYRKDDMQLQCISDIFSSYSLLTESDQKVNMARCGYAAFTTGNLVVLSLNTLLWTHRIRPPIDDTDADPCGQFEFLHTELLKARAASRAVIVLSHIPPVIDLYSLILRGKFTDVKTDMYWKPRFQTSYFDRIAEFSDVIRLQVYGHTHAFSLHGLTRTKVPLLVVPAVSPIFSNLPSFISATFTDDWHLTAMQQNYLDLGGVWQDGLEIKSALGLQVGFDNVSDINTVIYGMLHNNDTWSSYLKIRGGGYENNQVFANNTCNDLCRVFTVCSMVSETYDEIQNCTKTNSVNHANDSDTSRSRMYIILLIIAVIVIVVVLAAAGYFYVWPRCMSSKPPMRGDRVNVGTHSAMCTVLAEGDVGMNTYASTQRRDTARVEL